MAVSTEDLVIRAELRSTVGRQARADREEVEALGGSIEGLGRSGRRGADGLGRTGDAAERAARAMGHARDAQGRWTDSTGRHLTVQERANAGLRNTNDALTRTTRNSSAAEKATGRLGGMLKRIGGAAVAGLAITGLGGIVSGLGGMIEAERQAAKVDRITRQTIEATGGAAKISAEQVNDLTIALSNKTGIDDEIIKKGSNLLLTFKGIRNEAGAGNDVFNQATAAALDLSAAGFGSVESASVMLGKALNDPVKGVSALRRVGVALTDQQVEQVKALQATGDTLGAQKIILGEVAGQVGGAAEAAADPMQRLRTIVERLAGDTVAQLLPALDAFATFLADKGLPWLTRTGDAARDLWARFTATGVLDRAAEGLRALADGARSAASWLSENRDVVGAVVAGIGAALGVLAAVRIATAAWAAVQAVLNAALFANPLGLIVLAIGALVGVLVLAWQRSETFRSVVLAVWAAIRTGAAAVVGWLVGTALPFVLSVWNGIAAGARWLWSNVLSPVFSFVVAAFRVLVGGMKSLWESVLAPVFRAVAAVASWLWNTVLAVVFLAVAVAWKVLSTAFRTYWTTILSPVLTAVAKAATWLWETVLSPVFGWIGQKWDETLAGMKAVWELILKPALGYLGDAVEALRDRFSTGVDAIAEAWAGLKEKAKEPVRFVVEKIINDGIIGTFNKIAGTFDAKTIDPVKLPAGFAGGGYTGPGGKYEPAGVVHAGEYVFTKEQTSAAGVGNLAAYAAALDGYAKGGLVAPVRGGRVSSEFGPRGGGMHRGRDYAVPVGTPIYAAASGRVVESSFHPSWGNRVKLDHGGGLATQYAHLVRKGLGLGASAAQGQQVGLSGNTGNSTGPHLHFEVYQNGQRVDPRGFLGGSGDAGSGGGWADALLGLVGSINPFDGLVDKLVGKVLDNPFGSLAVGMARKGIGAATSWVTSKAAAVGDHIGNAVDAVKGALGFGSAPKGVERWRGTVEQALGIMGLPKSLADTTLRRMNQESSGNPRAVNTWDSNARQGADMRSKGLMQVIGPTFRANAHPDYNRDIFDPLSNILASMRYALRRYGSLPAAYNRKGGYADGGLVDATLFDTGGLWKPGTLGMNLSGATEGVLNPHVTELVQESARGRGGAGGSITIEAGAVQIVVGDTARADEVRDVLREELPRLLANIERERRERSPR